MRSLPSQSTDLCDVVLVSCYELGHEPLSILTPAGVLDRAGFDARTLDVAVEDFDAHLIAGSPLVSISTPMHTALRLGVRVAARVREINPDTHICFFGLYAGLHRDELLSGPADTCLGAEFETDLLELVRRVKDRGASPARRVRAPTAAHPDAGYRERSLDLTPRRDTRLEESRYARLRANGLDLPTGYVMSTRGCKHTCRHCPIPASYEGTFYALPPDQVLADIDAAIGLGARHITFADADFLNGPTHALRITRELHHRHPGVSFDYTAKIEHLLRHTEVVDELRALGNLFVVSAVESFNDDVLRQLHKKHTADDALSVIRAFEKRNLTLRPSLIPFTPWETRESLARMFEIVAGEGLVDRIDPVQYSIRLLIPAGSLLLRDAALAGQIGEFDHTQFTHRWAHPDPAMDDLQARLAEISSSAADDGSSPLATFERMAGEVIPGRKLSASTKRRGEAPRLTEDWFC